MNAREFAERSLLGVLLHQPARITNLVGWLAPQDFHRPAHQVIYRELRDMVAEATTEATAQAAARSPVVELSGRYAVPGVDPVTLYDRIQASGELDRRGISALSLLTLMETAPTLATAQPEQYGQMVLEASIRRAVAQDGLRVGQVADTSTDLAHLLAAVETALEKVDHALRRWEGAATSSTIQLTTRADRSARRAAAGRRAGYAELVAVPSPEQLAQAERGLLGAVLHNPELLGSTTSPARYCHRTSPISGSPSAIAPPSTYTPPPRPLAGASTRSPSPGNSNAPRPSTAPG